MTHSHLFVCGHKICRFVIILHFSMNLYETQASPSVRTPVYTSVFHAVATLRICKAILYKICKVSLRPKSHHLVIR